MKIYIKKQLLEDSKQIEAWQKERQALLDSLNRARKSLAHWESERGRIQQRIDYARAMSQQSVPRPEPGALATDPGARKYQLEQLERSYQARLESARKPYLEQLKFLESELDEWQRQHGQELESLKQDVSTLEKRLLELEAKLKDFIALDAQDLITK
jgi:polyhydroxyalkanoate synthesis regulator phasin